MICVDTINFIFYFDDNLIDFKIINKTKNLIFRNIILYCFILTIILSFIDTNIVPLHIAESIEMIGLHCKPK